MDGYPKLDAILHHNWSTRTLSAEAPRFFFYIRNLIWSKFAKQVVYHTTEFSSRYDFALQSADLSVFYVFDEQHLIVCKNLPKYLEQIYQSDAHFIVPLLTASYPERIWAKFESDHFKQRFGTGNVISIHFSQAVPGMFER